MSGDDLEFSITANTDGFVKPVDEAIDKTKELEGVVAGLDLNASIDVGVNANTEDLYGVKDVMHETEVASDSLRSSLGAPFVVTAGDAIEAFQKLGDTITAAESKIAGLNQGAAGISLISGINEQAARDLAVAYSDEDMSMQGALETMNILSKQHVTSKEEMESLLESWKAFGNANDEQAAALQEKLIPAWNQFNISAEEQPEYFDELTTLFQTTNLSASEFSSNIVKSGKSLSDLGMSLDQVAKLYLTMEESGLTDRKGMAELSSAIAEINSNAEATGEAVPKGTDALKALTDAMGIADEKIQSANQAFENSTGAVERWSEAMDKGDTASQKIAAQIEKATVGLQEMVMPLAPAAAGFTELASAGADLAILKSFLGGGSVSSEIAGIGKAAAGAEGGVVALTGALGTIGGAATLGGIAAVGLAIAAWETDFMDVRTNTLGAMDDLANGLENAATNIAASGAEAAQGLGESLIGGLNTLPIDLSPLTANLETALGALAPIASAKGSEAASAWIEAWNENVKTGRLEVPNIPGSETATMTNSGTPYQLPDGKYYVNGTIQNGLPGSTVNNSTIIGPMAEAYGTQKAQLDKLIGTLPTSQEQGKATSEGVVSGIEAVKPTIREWLDAMGKQGADPAKYQAMYDKAMASQYGTTTPGPDGTKSNPLNVALAPSSVPSSSIAPIMPSGTFEKPSGQITDTMSTNPQRWLTDTIERLSQNYSSTSDWIKDLNASGISLEDRIKTEFEEEKSTGVGGGVDWDSFWSEASKAFNNTNKIARDTSTQVDSLSSEMDKYNAAAGTQTTEAQSLTAAIGSINTAQLLYEQAIQQGGISSDEAAGIQAALADATKLMGDAGVDATGGLSGVPGALQTIAKSAQDLISSLSSSVSIAQSGMNGWTFDTSNAYESDKSQVSKIDIYGVLGLTDGNISVNTLANANQNLIYSQDIASISSNLYSNVIQSTANTTASASSAISSSISNMANVAASAASSINAAAASVRSSSRSSGGGGGSSLSNVNPFGYSGSDRSPCGWGAAFEDDAMTYNDWELSGRYASGGPVAKNGPAILHQGEYVLRRDQVANIGRGAGNVSVNVNMNNSRFGNAEMAKDLPQTFARITKRALKQAGMI